MVVQGSLVTGLKSTSWRENASQISGMRHSDDRMCKPRRSIPVSRFSHDVPPPPRDPAMVVSCPAIPRRLEHDTALTRSLREDTGRFLVPSLSAVSKSTLHWAAKHHATNGGKRLVTLDPSTGFTSRPLPRAHNVAAVLQHSDRVRTEDSARGAKKKQRGTTMMNPLEDRTNVEPYGHRAVNRDLSLHGDEQAAIRSAASVGLSYTTVVDNFGAQRHGGIQNSMTNVLHPSIPVVTTVPTVPDGPPLHAATATRRPPLRTLASVSPTPAIADQYRPTSHVGANLTVQGQLHTKAAVASPVFHMSLPLPPRMQNAWDIAMSAATTPIPGLLDTPSGILPDRTFRANNTAIPQVVVRLSAPPALPRITHNAPRKEAVGKQSVPIPLALSLPPSVMTRPSQTALASSVSNAAIPAQPPVNWSTGQLVNKPVDVHKRDSINLIPARFGSSDIRKDIFSVARQTKNSSTLSINPTNAEVADRSRSVPHNNAPPPQQAARMTAPVVTGLSDRGQFSSSHNVTRLPTPLAAQMTPEVAEVVDRSRSVPHNNAPAPQQAAQMTAPVVTGLSNRVHYSSGHQVMASTQLAAQTLSVAKLPFRQDSGTTATFLKEDDQHVSHASHVSHAAAPVADFLPVPYQQQPDSQHQSTIGTALTTPIFDAADSTATRTNATGILERHAHQPTTCAPLASNRAGAGLQSTGTVQRANSSGMANTLFGDLVTEKPQMNARLCSTSPAVSAQPVASPLLGTSRVIDSYDGYARPSSQMSIRPVPNPGPVNSTNIPNTTNTTPESVGVHPGTGMVGMDTSATTVVKSMHRSTTGASSAGTHAPVQSMQSMQSISMQNNPTIAESAVSSAIPLQDSSASRNTASAGHVTREVVPLEAWERTAHENSTGTTTRLTERATDAACSRKRRRLLNVKV